MEQEQTPKQVEPEDTKTISMEERDAKREFNTHLRLHAYKEIREETKRNISQLGYINTNIMHILFVCMCGEHA